MYIRSKKKKKINGKENSLVCLPCPSNCSVGETIENIFLQAHAVSSQSAGRKMPHAKAEPCAVSKNQHSQYVQKRECSVGTFFTAAFDLKSLVNNMLTHRRAQNELTVLCWQKKDIPT